MSILSLTELNRADRVFGETLVHLSVSDIDQLSCEDIINCSPSERVMASSIKCATARLRYLKIRCFVRRQIGQRLNRSFYDGELSLGSSGKPRLADTGIGLYFNISHSRSIIACVTAFGVEVGIDIERNGRQVSSSVIPNVFVPDEVSHLLAADDPHVEALRGWTRKEAVLKCLGSGLNQSPKSFQVPILTSRLKGRVSNAPVFTDSGDTLYLCDIECDGVFVGAIAASRPLNIDYAASRVEAADGWSVIL